MEPAALHQSYAGLDHAAGMSPAHPRGRERSYLLARLSLGARRSSGSCAPRVAPEPGDTRRSPGTRCALRCTQTGAPITPHPNPIWSRV